MTEQLFTFQEDYSALVLIMAAVLLVILVLKEWLRENKRRRVGRIVAAVFVIIALLGIMFQPAVRRPLERSNLVILTDGYHEAQLDSLKRLLPKFISLEIDSVNTLIYPDLNEFGQVFVLGNGIPSYDLWQFEGRQVSYLPGMIEKGITQLNVPRTPLQDQPFSIVGRYKGYSGVQLTLNGAAGNLDSAQVDDNGHFELTTRPKASGQFIYTLSNSDDGTIEKIPVNVLPQKRLKILIINAFPTFETRYLKTFLAETGHEVIVRNQVSKDIFKYEYFNTKKKNFSRFTSTILEKQDLMIMDLASLNNLSRTESQLLRTAIKEQGLGLFIQPEQALFLSKTWMNLQSNSVEEEHLLFNLESDTFSISRYNRLLKLESNQFELLTTSKEHIALAERNGLGKIGTTVLKDLYRQQLAGDSTVYAHVWTEILNGLSKLNEEKVGFSGLDQLVYPLAPLNFTVQNIAADGKLTIENQNIPLAQNALIPEQWEGLFWPRAAGWHQIEAGEDSTVFYVYKEGDWKTRRDFSRSQANEKFFAQQATSSLVVQYHHKAIPKIWFYLLFLFGLGFLWLEPKI